MTRITRLLFLLTPLLFGCNGVSHDMIDNNLSNKIRSYDIYPIMRAKYKDKAFYFFLEKNTNSDLIDLKLRWHNRNIMKNIDVHKCTIEFFVNKESIMSPVLVSEEISIASYDINKKIYESELTYSISIEDLERIYNADIVETYFSCGEIRRAQLNRNQNKFAIADFLKKSRRE